jgi:DNA-directed RNA polymerase subunit omega
MEVITLPIEVKGDGEIDSRYRLVILAAQRARQLMEGSRPVAETRYTKATTIGLEEVLDDRVEFLLGKEAKVAQKEARRLREEEIKSRALLAKEEELATEIKKDLSVYLAEKRSPGLAELGASDAGAGEPPSESSAEEEE